MINNLFGFSQRNGTSRGSASEFLAHGDKTEKQQLFTEALKKADQDQRAILNEYDRKYQQGGA